MLIHSYIYVSAIVSDFGTLNSRNIDAISSAKNTIHLLNFIEQLGFDFNKGDLRTHNNKKYCELLPLVTSCLSINDFKNYTEVTDNQYQKLNIFRGDFAMFTYKAIMATDILLPLAINNKKPLSLLPALKNIIIPILPVLLEISLKKLEEGMKLFSLINFKYQHFIQRLLMDFSLMQKCLGVFLNLHYA